VGKVDLPVFLQQQLAARQGNVHEILPSWRGYGVERGEDLATQSVPFRYTVRDGKKIGTHNGAHFYTIGQRKGLGIGGRKESLFVLATDVKENVIYVGEGDSHPGLYRSVLRIKPEEVHWVDPTQRMTEGERRRYDVRIRYRQALQGAELVAQGDGMYLLFDEPQRGVAAGQFAAWYDGEVLVGSGVIER
jgi:tRNA-specific 2-thiouridylase